MLPNQTRAASEAAETQAKADTAGIIEDGRARADALRALASAWRDAGPSARQVTLSQKLVPIVEAVANTVADAQINKLNVIGPSSNGHGLTDGTGNAWPAAMLPMLEQLKALYGVDLAAKLRSMAPLEPEAPPNTSPF